MCRGGTPCLEQANPMTELSNTAFEKARLSLWASLQKHLTTVYEAERSFLKAVPIADVYPFPIDLLTAEQLDEYNFQRSKLQDLLVDETAQLDSLVKAVRLKSYSEEDKKQLFLLILGYMDIAESIFGLLKTYRPTNIPTHQEVEEAVNRFGRVKNFVRLNVKGIKSLLVTLNQ